MPELPEAETIRRALQAFTAGAQITKVQVLRAAYLTPPFGRQFARLIRQACILGWDRHGKALLARLDNGQLLMVRLGMSGRVLLLGEKRAVPPHTHLVLGLDSGNRLAFADVRRLGGVNLLNSADLPTIGVDALSPRASADWFARLIRGRKVGIKQLLMDQSEIAGLGNIYSAEALFRAGIHPLRPAGSLHRQEVARLCRAIKSVLRSAIRSGGTTIADYQRADGSEGLFQARLRVYGREGRRCVRCGATVVKIKVSGRGTCYCPRCQPLRRTDKA